MSNCDQWNSWRVAVTPSGISGDQDIDFRHRLNQPLLYGLTEPASVPWLPRPTDHNVRNTIFFSEGCHRADHVGSFKRHLSSAELLDERQVIADFTLQCGRDAGHIFLWGLNVDGLPRRAQSIGHAGRFTDQVIDIGPARAQANHDAICAGLSRFCVSQSLVQSMGDLVQGEFA